MIITIDGPAGSGKSSAAKGLAQRLGFEMLETGAMYRAVALAVIQAGVNDSDPAALDRLMQRIQIEMPPGRVLLDGADVTAAVRTPAIASEASRLAALPAVRRFLAGRQREIAQGRNMVCEGRDQGTAVFPDAECKFFLQADPSERARRRWQELADRNDRLTIEQVLAEQRVRDERDAARDLAPMVPAKDAIVIDTTRLTLEQVLDRLERDVRRCMPA
jgi:cytidylate kinase